MLEACALLALICFANFAYSSVEVSYEYFGGVDDIVYRTVMTVYFAIGSAAVIVFGRFPKFQGVRAPILGSLAVMVILTQIAGVLVIAFGAAMGKGAYYSMFSVALVALAITTAGVHLYSLMTYLMQHLPRATQLFPLTEMAWDLGTVTSTTFLLLVEDAEYYVYIYLPLAGVLLLSGAVFMWKHQPLTFEEAPAPAKDLAKNSILWYDIMVIFYVLCASKCVDPVIYSVVEDLIDDDDMVLEYLVISASSSFLISTALVFYLEHLEKRFLMLLGALTATVGIFIIGPIAYLAEGGTWPVTLGTILLEVGESIGTGSGFAALFYTLKQCLQVEMTHRLVWVVVVMYVFLLSFCRIVGPIAMLWLVTVLNYRLAAVIFAGAGLIVSGVYYRHYSKHISLKNLRAAEDEEANLLENEE